MLDFTDYDIAIYLYEELRAELKQLIKRDVIYINVVRDRINDIGILNAILNSEEISDTQKLLLDSLLLKHN